MNAEQTTSHIWQSAHWNHIPGFFHALSKAQLGDIREQTNLQAYLELCGLDSQDLVEAEQVHAHRVAIVGRADRGSVIAGVDGLLTADRGIALGIRIADCLPVYLYDTANQVIGILHAGWRGLLRGVIQSGLDSCVQEYGSSLGTVEVLIGPSIRACCFEVGQEVAEQFSPDHADAINYSSDGVIHIDLTRVATSILLGSGIKATHIEVSLDCSYCMSDSYHSYRRDGSASSRMLALIVRR